MPRTLRWLAVALTVLGVVPASARAADPDWDGDGAIATDCRPLDPEVHPAAADVPDLAFEDSNCDRIDGDAAKAVFVSPAGDPLGDGTRAQPVTIARAVVLARDTGRDVYAAVGTHGEALSVMGPGFDGFGLYGGYEPGTWSRTRTTPTTLTGSPEGAVVESATGVVIQLVRLTGTAAPGDGKSAYGLRARGSTVALEEVTTAAGRGSPGKSQQDESSTTRKADPAENGSNSTCTDLGLGAGGGNDPAPSGSLRGGLGGAGGDKAGSKPGVAGSRGLSSPSASGGAGGVGGTSSSDMTVHGMSGSPGSTGADGPDGVGGAGGEARPDGWLVARGADGTSGDRGSSGGGGGGGAGRAAGAAGAGGGQGGHGGRAGLGGHGGTPGGGSFGVYLWQSSLVAIDSDLAGGGGGDGGDGGAGAPGGEGGEPGIGGRAAFCGAIAGNGGDGGKGGHGGAGGDGAGGAGGPSAAVLREGVGAHFASRDSTLSAGAPGAGGAGGGNAPGGATPAAEAVVGGELPGDYEGDGHNDATDPCPVQPGAATGCPPRAAALSDKDGDGIPDSGEDADGDGVPDMSDPCPAQAASGNGCPDPPPPAADPPPADPPPPSLSGVLSQPPILPETLAARVSHKASMRGKLTRFDRLVVKDVLAGATVTVTCKGKKCPRKRWTVTAERAGSLALAPFRKKWMPPRTKLEVAIAKPGAVSRITTYTLRGPKSPKTLTRCLPPGATTRVSCG